MNRIGCLIWGTIPGGTEESHYKLKSGYSLSRPTFEPDIHLIQVTKLTAWTDIHRNTPLNLRCFEQNVPVTLSFPNTELSLSLSNFLYRMVINKVHSHTRHKNVPERVLININNISSSYRIPTVNQPHHHYSSRGSGSASGPSVTFKCFVYNR